MDVPSRIAMSDTHIVKTTFLGMLEYVFQFQIIEDIFPCEHMSTLKKIINNIKVGKRIFGEYHQIKEMRSGLTTQIIFIY